MNQEDLLLKYFNVTLEIEKIEQSMYNPNFIEWNSFIYLEELREKVRELYESIFPDDSKEYPIIDFINTIVEDDYTYFDTRLLSEEQIKKHSTKIKRGIITLNKEWMSTYSWEQEEEDALFLTKELKDENPHCKLHFKNIQEAIKYALNY